MKRMMCGLAVITLAAVSWSCNGDPTSDTRGEGLQVTADPSHVVLGQGSQKFVTVQEVDVQGNQQVVDFQVQDVQPGITVEEDTTFLQTTIGTHIQTSQRFIVTGSDLVNSSFLLKSGADTLRVPVTVTPNEFTPLFSNAAPGQNQAITVTAPAGYTFQPNAFVSFGADPAVTVSRSADGTTMTVVPQPAFPDPTEIPPTPKFRTATVDSVEAAYIPGVPLVLPSTDSVLIPLLDTVPGHNATSTAPVIPTPGQGESSAFFDTGGFTGTDITGDTDPATVGPTAQYYQFTLAETDTVTVTLNWPASSLADLDLVLCSDAGCSAPNFVAAGASHPESGDYILPPGTYYIAAVLFFEDAPPTVADKPTRIDITLSR